MPHPIPTDQEIQEFLNTHNPHVCKKCRIQIASNWESILAERERCARLAEDWMKSLVRNSVCRKDYGAEIAAAIRETK